MAFAAVILGDGQQYYRRVGKVKPVHRSTLLMLPMLMPTKRTAWTKKCLWTPKAKLDSSQRPKNESSKASGSQIEMPDKSTFIVFLEKNTTTFPTFLSLKYVCRIKPKFDVLR